MGLDGAVECRSVWKSFKGRAVLKGVSMSVPEGAIYVLAGPNGAGKTTIIRVLLGLVRRDRGHVRVLGVDPEASEWPRVRRAVGYLPEDAQPYERLTGLENIVFYARVYSGGDEELARSYINRALEIAGLGEEVLGRRVSTYSRGMKRRLLLAITLMHSPLIAFLDEPTSGLDVFSSFKVKRMIKSMARSGVTFLVTTHDLKEAEELASMVGFISEGRLVFEGTPGEALEEYGSESLEEAFVRAFGGEGL